MITRTKLNISKNLNLKIKKYFSSYSIDEKKTIKTIRQTYNKHKIILDPHTAVGFAASLEYLKKMMKKIRLLH